MAAQHLLGDIELYDPNGSSSFSQWVARFELFCETNGVVPEPVNADGDFFQQSNQRRNLFLTKIGARAFSIVYNAALPDPPQNYPIPALIQTLNQHFEPVGLVEANRFSFHQRVQLPNESVFEFLNALQASAASCQWGNFYDEALKGRLICGIRHQDTRQKLLATPNLTFLQARVVALQDDTMRTQLRTLAQAQAQAQATVHAVSAKNQVQKGGKPHAPSNAKPQESRPIVKDKAEKKKLGPCHRCGRRHDVKTCPVKDWECHLCHKTGHIRKCCPLKKQVNSQINSVEIQQSPDLNRMQLLWRWLMLIFTLLVKRIWRVKTSSTHVIISTAACSPKLVDVSVNGTIVIMEVDSGAGVTVMSYPMFKDLFPALKVKPTPMSLHSASGLITVVGECVVNVQICNSSFELPMLICKDIQAQYPLLGRAWLDVIFPKWRDNFPSSTSIMSSINVLKTLTVPELQNLFPRIFDSSSDSPIEGFTARLRLKDNAIPVKHRSYKVPFGLIDITNKLLDEWEVNDKAVRVRQADWASPCFPVPKKDGNYRLVVDFKMTLNPQLRVDHYPIPTPEEIFADLSNSAYFVSLDLKDAYTQLLLHPDSQECCVVNTPKGFYKLKRLIYGIASSAAIFQSVMEEILLNIPSVKVYLDNILIYGPSLPDVTQTTLLVLSRLERHNVRLNLKKCEWFVEKLEFLGFVLSKLGRQPNPALIRDIDNFKVPDNVKQVRSFLGMINFYSVFIPQFATVASPLYNLLKVNTQFKWTKDCQVSFDTCKTLLKTDKLLMHFNPSLPIVIYTDASPYGIGSVLCHTVNFKNKLVDQPVMLVSSTLTAAQQNYAQIDREGLAVIHAISKFHRFIWGRVFTLVTDCEAIKRILDPSKALPVRTGHRLQHWAAILQAYNYKLIHKKSSYLVVADALSRLPSPVMVKDLQIKTIKVATEIPLSNEQIVSETYNDPILSQVFQFVLLGWPPKDKFKDNPTLQKYFLLRDCLTICNKCLLFSARVVIPEVLRATVLQTLHQGHPGIVRTKLLARQSVWWPSLGEDITQLVSNCEICALINFKPQKMLIPWSKCTFPFERVHIDFYQKDSLSYFIMVDAYSKWLHVCHMPTTNANQVIDQLMCVFALFGLPKVLVSDNGPPFDSDDYAAFCTHFNVKVVHSPPYSPESNGQAERCVAIAKKGVEKIVMAEGSSNSNVTVVNVQTINLRLNKFLFNYRNTPTTSTHKSPNELLLQYRPRTMLTQLLPQSNVPLAEYHFREGETVAFKLNKRSPIVKGVIVKVQGPNRYVISISGVERVVHHNQLTRAP